MNQIHRKQKFNKMNLLQLMRKGEFFMSCLHHSQFVEHRSVNHEFNNALASVKCLTELLAEYPGLESGDRIRFLTIMRQETERMVRLSNGLRAVTAYPDPIDPHRRKANVEELT
jgi:signal transduction histidine kinase